MSSPLSCHSLSKVGLPFKVGPVGLLLCYLPECPHLLADPLEVHLADLFLEVVGLDLLMEGHQLQS